MYAARVRVFVVNRHVQSNWVIQPFQDFRDEWPCVNNRSQYECSILCIDLNGILKIYVVFYKCMYSFIKLIFFCIYSCIAFCRRLYKECKFHCLFTRHKGHQLTFLGCVHIGIWHVWTVHTLKTYCTYQRRNVIYDKSRVVTKYTVYYDQRENINIYTNTTWVALSCS